MDTKVSVPDLGYYKKRREAIPEQTGTAESCCLRSQKAAESVNVSGSLKKMSTNMSESL